MKTTHATKLKVNGEEVNVIGTATTKGEAKEDNFVSETPTVAVCWFKGTPLKGFGHDFADAINSLSQKIGALV